MNILAPDLPSLQALPAGASRGRPDVPFDYLSSDAWRQLATQARSDTAESDRAMATIARHFKETALVQQFMMVMKASSVLENDPIWLWLELFSIAYSSQNSTVGAHCEALGKNTRALSSLAELNGRYATLMATCLADLERVAQATTAQLGAAQQLVDAVGHVLGNLRALPKSTGARTMVIGPRFLMAWSAGVTILLIVVLGMIALR